MNKTIFKTALVFLFVFISVGFVFGAASGTVVAQEDASQTVDSQLEDNEDYWYGMVLSREQGIDPFQSYSLIKIGTSNAVWSPESDADGKLIIDTKYLSEGEFKLVNKTSKEEIASFGLKKQDLTISPSELNYEKGSSNQVSYSVSSNRESYKLAVFSSILSTSQLKTVFSAHNPKAKDVARDSRKEVILSDSSESLTLNPSSLQQNYYYFKYYVIDSEATTSAQLQVTNSNSQFGDSSKSNSAYASITIEDRRNLSETTVNKITVDKLDLSDGGFLVIYDDGQLTKTTQYFSSGNYTDLQFDVSIPIKSASTIRAVAYKDSNDDKQFTQGEDSPYQVNGELVVETGQVHPKVEQSTDGNDTDDDKENDSDNNTDNDDNTNNDDNDSSDNTNGDTPNNTNESENNVTQPSSNTNNPSNNGLLPDSSILLLIFGGLGGLVGIVLVALVARKLIASYIDTSTVTDKATKHLPLPPGPESDQADDATDDATDDAPNGGKFDPEQGAGADSVTETEAPTEENGEFTASPNRDGNFQTDAEANSIQSETDGPPDPKQYDSTETDETDEMNEGANTSTEVDEKPIRDDNAITDEVEKVSPDEDVSLGSQKEEDSVTEASFTPPDEAANEYSEENNSPDEKTSSQNPQDEDQETSSEAQNETETETETEETDEDGDPLSDF